MTARNLKRAKSLREQGRLDPRIQVALDHANPGWAITRALRTTADNLYAIKAFQTEHGRYPRQKATDAEERRLGAAWANIKVSHRADRLSGSHADLAGRLFGPGWSDVGGSTVENLHAIKAFYVEHGRYPSAKATDEEERRRGVSWTRIRGSHRSGELSGSHADLAGRLFGPGWSDIEDPITEHMHAVKAFHTEHGRYPSASAADAEERRLGKAWDNITRRHRANNLSNTHADLGVELFGPGWSGKRKRGRAAHVSS